MKTEILITNLLSAILGSFVFCLTFFYTANGLFYLLLKKPFFHITKEIVIVTCIVFMITFLWFAKWE